MRKWLLFLLTVAMFAGSLQIGYGATRLSDIKGTPYEEAVLELVEKKIISGYEDGTFQPERALNRAEACVAIVNSLLYGGGSMETDVDSRFIDMEGYYWAKGHIDFAYGKRFVSGDGDRTFRPDDTVMYCEYVTMLVGAAGFRGEYLEGQWPDNYMKKAVEMGLFQGLTLKIPADQEKPVTRGDAAILLKNAQDYIEGIYSPNYAVKAEKGKAEGQTGTRMEALLFQYTVGEPRSLRSYGDNKPSDGNRLVALDITMKNIVNAPVTMYDADFLLVFEGNLGAYCLDATDHSMMPQSFELMPGEEKTYTFVFDVPRNIELFSVYHIEQFEEDVTGDIFFVNFTLEKEPEGDDTQL